MASVNCLLPYPEHTLFEQCRLLTDNEPVDRMMMIAKDDDGNEMFLLVTRLFPNFCNSRIFLKLGSKLNSIYRDSKSKYVADDGWQTRDTLLELVEPMKIWRISFNGLLDVECNEIDSEIRECHVRFNFLWHPSSSPVLFEKCADPGFFVRNDSPVTEHFIKDCYFGYEQWGMLHGKVYVDDKTELLLNMKCLRKRNWETNTEHLSNFILFGNDESYFSVNSSQKWRAGHIRTLQKHNILGSSRLQLSLNTELKRVIICTGKHCKWKIKESTLRSSISLDGVIFDIADYRVNGDETRGYCISYERNDDKVDNHLSVKTDAWQNRFTDIEDGDELTVDLTSEMCMNINLVGGKASFLARLIFLQNHTNISSFKLMEVPPGLCITSCAMIYHLNNNTHLKEQLEFLQDRLYSIPNNDAIIYFLNSLKNLWDCSNMPENLKSLISRRIDPNKTYAVRSSGISEDNVNYSFAGQNSTYLNVSGVGNILDAVKSCWASVYSFQSVQYRRENGIGIEQRMAIIVQEMVKPEIAGVLFTLDPVTGDPRYMVLSYCFGEGQDVVSGHSVSNNLYYNKRDQLLTEMKPFSSNRNVYSKPIIFENVLRRLCQICEQFEETFDSSLDFEWAISNEVIYILQCRPITATFAWSDFEIAHELDSAFTESDAITFHNCGEVMVGASSPLTLTFVDAIIEESYTFGNRHPSYIYHKKLLSIIQFRVAINLFNSLLLDVKEQIPFEQKAIDMAVCGRLITDDKLYQMARKRNGIVSPRASLYKLYTILKLCKMNERVVSKAKALESSFHIDTEEFSSPFDMFQHISQQAYILRKASEYHLTASSVDSFLKTITLRIMSDGNPEKLDDCISNMSSVLSQGKETVSSEVPHCLQKIASIITEHTAKEFLDVDPSEGCIWLKNNCVEGYEALTEFLVRHGFRGIKEVDLIAETWSMKPATIIEVLQSLIKAGVESPINLKSVDMHVDSLSTSGNVVKRKLVNWLLSRCQHAVLYREQTKRSFVSVIDQFRLAFRELSQLMFRNNMLPETAAIFFLTYYELYRIVHFGEKTSTLNKVLKRRRLWNRMENLSFPNVIIGLPEEIGNEIVQSNNSCRVQGFPVTSNSAKGRACVLHDIRQANELLRGDILVTKCIDIGWSPYFPMLGGIITEVGGFVSHGAVIAREYGLPCIVSVPEVTKIFRTGDIIAIVGSNGTVQKIPILEDDVDD